MVKFISLFLVLSALFFTDASAQILQPKENFTEKDSLRGSLRPERTSFNVLHYDLFVDVDIAKQYLHGSNSIRFEVVEKTKRIQLDLYQNMQVDSIVFEQQKLDFERKYDAVFIDFPRTLAVSTNNNIEVFFSGNPTKAKNAPWDGGFDFKKDRNGNDFVGVAVQGDGASLWFPNKDHLSDEPDEGARIKIRIPKHLVAVSNGRLTAATEDEDGGKTWHWEVNNPINNYNITLNIGDYVLIEDTYTNGNQSLDLAYYVLSYNKAKAQRHFEVVHEMMDCFYEKLGPYPFTEDSFKLVETPYLGMEHQSAVAYGNRYMNGYLGNDLSGTGAGLDWDFIIIHESAHEWFGNSISVGDIADLWIHEGFTTYAESIFIECRHGEEEASKYLYGIRNNIANERPMVAHYGVNQSGPGDIYYKGANMIHSLRNLVADDELWFATLRNFTSRFKHQITNTKEVVSFFNSELGKDYSPFFEQYLYYKEIPVLQLRKKGKRVEARWKVFAKNFEMPVELVFIESENVYRINLNSDWIKTDLRVKDLEKVKFDNYHFYYDIEFLNELD